MASLTVLQLLTPSTEEQSLQNVLDVLTVLKFPATSWQSGSLARTLIQLVAKLHSDLTQTVAVITAGRFNDEAQGPWLTLFSDSHYDNQRVDAVRTLIQVTLQDAGGAGPFPLQAQQVVLSDAGGHPFRNVGKTLIGAVGGVGGVWTDDPNPTLLNSGSLTLQFQADVAGAASSGTPPFTFVTPLAGVIVNTTDNPYTNLVVGTDAEQDPTLQARNRSKWAALSYAAPADAYVEWALTASPQVTRVFPNDNNPRGAGTLDVYIAGSNGALPSLSALEPIALVTDFIYGQNTFAGKSRRPLGADVQVFSANNLTVALVGTVYAGPSSVAADVLAAVLISLEALFESIPIGGTKDPTDHGYVMFAQIYRAVMTVPGVVNFYMNAPLADVPLASTDVAVPDLSALRAVQL